jgi:hypothetical protein
MKYGFASFVKSRFPNPVIASTVSRFFNKFTDFKDGDSGLWCYLTTTGKVASRRTDQKGQIMFLRYRSADNLAEVVVISPYHPLRTAYIDPTRIFRPEEA